MPTSPRTPAARHYIEAEQGLATLSVLGADEGERIVETLVALTHAVLSIAATLTRPSVGGLRLRTRPLTARNERPAHLVIGEWGARLSRAIASSQFLLPSEPRPHPLLHVAALIIE